MTDGLDRFMDARERDLAYAREYGRAGCGPGRHSFGKLGNDPTVRLVCEWCGVTKKTNFIEGPLIRVGAQA